MEVHDDKRRESNGHRAIMAAIGAAAFAYSFGVLSRGGVTVLRVMGALSEPVGELVVRLTTVIAGINGAIAGWRSELVSTKSVQVLDASRTSDGDDRRHKTDPVELADSDWASRADCRNARPEQPGKTFPRL